MDEDIVIGMIVGAMTASSLYVWNSNKIYKAQKAILLLFVVFPPLQWVSILLTLAYNKSKLQNSTEFKKTATIDKNKSELEKAKESLKSLKNSGVINNEEYDLKVEKIKNQINNYDILNTNEYKQLKYLFDSNILTKQEFEEKIKLLENNELSSLSSVKKITVGENNTIIYSNKTIGYTTKIIDSSYSFKFGNFKSWTIQFENSEILNYYTKTSNNTYFISVNGFIKNFEGRDEFILYAFDQVKN